jgi:hypothetical protein
MRSPLLTIDLGGQVECLRCGLVQAFDVAQWTDALDFAHGVADVSGPNPEGANPMAFGGSIAGRSRHAQIGITFTSSTKTQNGLIMDARGTRKHTLATTVSPGHPLCPTCKAPLEASVDPGGGAKTRCGRCGEEATYVMPPNAAAIYAPLRAVLANEQRTDKPVARTKAEGGVENAMCPRCGGSLPAGAGVEIIKCPYCNVTARVPGRLARRQRTAGEPPKMVPSWIRVEGISSNRKKLLRGKSEDDDDDDDDDDLGVPPAMMAGPGIVVVPPGASYGGSPVAPAWAHPNLQYAPPRSSSAVKTVIVVVVALVLLLAAGGAGVAFWLSSTDEPPPPAAPRPSPRKR